MPSAPPAFLRLLDPYDTFALILAIAITALVGLSLRRRFGPWVIALAAFVPVPAVALFAKQFDFAGWHAFMHASPIYQIIDRGVFRPEEPLYAGGAIRYPWVEHWLTAQASLITGVNPLVISLIAETFAYVVFLGSAAWLASTLTRDRVTIALATLLSAFGITLFHFGFLAAPAQRAFPPLWLDPRAVPLDKFLNITAAPIGYAAMVLAAAAGVRLVCGMGSARRMIVLIAACTLVAAFIHPLSWLGILAYEGVAGIVLLAARRRDELVRAGQLALAVGVPSALAFPYLRSVGESESSDGWMGITRSAELFGIKAGNVLFFLATFVLLAYLNRAELIRMVRERNRAAIMLLLAVVTLATAYLVVRAPGLNEYKFLLDLVPAAAAIMALSLRERLRNHRGLSLALLFLLVGPGCRLLGFRLRFGVTDPVRIEGRYQRALDPDVDQLYRWVASHTPKDAVFIAGDLRMPPLGRRSLYIAVDAPWKGPDGWGLRRKELLQWHVRRSDAEMNRRQRLASAVLSPQWDVPPADLMTAIQADVPGRPLFVHAQTPDVAAKLDSTPGFTRQFANPAGAVYAYARPAAAR
jgi:hypothetical protein